MYKVCCLCGVVSGQAVPNANGKTSWKMICRLHPKVGPAQIVAPHPLQQKYSLHAGSRHSFTKEEVYRLAKAAQNAAGVNPFKVAASTGKSVSAADMKGVGSPWDLFLAYAQTQGAQAVLTKKPGLAPAKKSALDTIFSSIVDVERKPKVIPDWPHTCHKCGGPAYMGLNEVDCKRKCSSKPQKSN